MRNTATVVACISDANISPWLLTFRWPLREKEEPAQLQVASKQEVLKKKSRKRKKKTKLFNLLSTITALQESLFLSQGHKVIYKFVFVVDSWMAVMLWALLQIIMISQTKRNSLQVKCCKRDLHKQCFGAIALLYKQPCLILWERRW